MLWRVCERFEILPPDIRDEFSKNTPWQQAQLFAYEQIRQYEESEEHAEIVRSGLIKKASKRFR